MRVTMRVQVIFAAVASIAAMDIAKSQIAVCSADLDCSLNGVCTSAGVCACDRPWTGPVCGELKFKTTPATAKSIYNISDPRNTWNGPIVTGPDGKFHIYNPIYRVGSLGGPTSILHGTADVVTGPWEWKSRPDLSTEGGENPAAVVFKNESGNVVYSLWIAGKVRLADSPDGPFTLIEQFSYPGGNPAPIFHKGAFYLVNQKTTEVYTTPRLQPGAKWTNYSDVNQSSIPDKKYFHVEDPFLWVDARGMWHIINHAYRNDEYEDCGNSIVSSHFFSTDGKDWHWAAQPYGHTVHYNDGSSHTYTTLERPNLHFDTRGQLTHLNFAADLVTGAEGCGNRTRHSHFGHTPCDNCKWDDHAGTIVVALDIDSMYV